MSHLAKVAATLGLILSAAQDQALADVKIGFHAPLTGFAAADGASARIAAELAVADLNAAGGMTGRRWIWSATTIRLSLNRRS